VNAQAIEAWIAIDIWRVWIVAFGAVVVMFSLSSDPSDDEICQKRFPDQSPGVGIGSWALTQDQA
jgi:hypothetical protein